MPNWKKVITSGSQAQLAGVTGSFTGSFIGDGSGLTGISAGGGGIFAQTGSYYSTTNNLQITGSLNIYKSGSTVFTIEGSQGTLFSVTDQLSGSLFSVNDISGIPIFEVFSDDTVKIGTFNSEAIIVNGTSAVITGSFTGSFVGDGSGLTGIVSSSYALTSSFAESVPDNLKKYRLELGVSSTSPITTGEKGRKVVPYRGVIIGWKLIADQSTTTELDVWKANNSIPTVSDTIVGSAYPALTAAELATSTTLTGWTTTVNPDDVFVLNVNSNDNATYILLELDILLT
jgi:hypothetical protein